MIKTELLVNDIITALDRHKAENIVKIDLRKIPDCFCKFFIICEGSSSSHVRSLAEITEEEIKENPGESPMHTEGNDNAEWIIMDYGDTVVHIFQKATRIYYNLEEFWSDAKLTKIKQTP